MTSPSTNTSPAIPAPALPPLSPAAATVPTLIEFLQNVPPPLTTFLVQLSPYIACIRRTIEVISWKTSYAESWLALGVWWAFCLLSGVTLRYALPFVVLLVLIRSHKALIPPPTTEQNLLDIVVDLSVIQTNIPCRPEIPVIPFNALIRACAILYIPYLLLTYFVHLRVLLGVAGTIVLTWRAPWARTLRNVLWRGAWIRWSISRAWSHLSGQPPPRLVISVQAQSQFALSTTSIRFLFTIFENQRWWVGLDWTAALLPGERASWCSATQQPLSPPSVFALPAPTSVFLSDGKGGMTRRTARWSWDEGEWKVVVKKENAGLKRVEKTLPTEKEEIPPSASRVDKTLKKMKDIGSPRLKRATRDVNGDVETAELNEEDSDLETELPETSEDPETEEPLTDGDGWVYGDNQWKAKSSQGGLGKYTKYRRWTRIAVLSEVVEPASAEEVRRQVERERKGSGKSISSQVPDAEEPQSPRTHGSQASNDDEDERGHKGLRKRLKAVVQGSTHL